MASPRSMKAGVTRTVSFEVDLFADRGVAEKAPDGARKAMNLRLLGSARDLIRGENRAAGALYALLSGGLGTLPHEPKARASKHAGGPAKGTLAPVSAHTRAYRALSGDWQPYGRPCYTPRPGQAIAGTNLTIAATEVLTRLTGSGDGKKKGKWRSIQDGDEGVPSFKIGRGGIPLNGKSIQVRPNGAFDLLIWEQRPKDRRPLAERLKQETEAEKAAAKEAAKEAREAAKAAGLSEGVRVRAHKLDAGTRAILARIRAGEATHGAGALIYDKRKRKWFLNFAWKLQGEEALIARDRTLVQQRLVGLRRRNEHPPERPALEVALRALEKGKPAREAGLDEAQREALGGAGFRLATLVPPEAEADEPLIAGIDVNMVDAIVVGYITEHAGQPERLPELLGLAPVEGGFVPEGAFAHDPQAKGKGSRKGLLRRDLARKHLGIRHERFTYVLPPTLLRAIDRVRRERSGRMRTTRAGKVAGARPEGLGKARGRERAVRAAEATEARSRGMVQAVLRTAAARTVADAKRRGVVLTAMEDLDRWSVEKHLKRTDDLSAAERKRERKWYIRWHQGELRAVTAAVSAREGIKSSAVFPEWTSWICHLCGRFYTAVDPEKGWGYHDHLTFACACGLRINGDRNSGLVIARRARGELGMFSEETGRDEDGKRVRRVVRSRMLLPMDDDASEALDKAVLREERRRTREANEARRDAGEAFGASENEAPLCGDEEARPSA